MQANQVLGIDIGGSGIKGAVVDLNTGELVTERMRLLTPQPAVPKAVAETVKELVKKIGWEGKPIGCGFPAIIQHGVAKSAANIDDAWIGTNAAQLLTKATGCPVAVLNDADAAGFAEMRFGVGMDEDGVAMLITIGTGLGSALFMDGQLVPNTEFGHLKFKGDIAENYASNRIRKEHDLSWQEWGNRFNVYLKHLERLFTPDLIILGGGVSKKHEKFSKYIDAEARVIPAKLLNNAGIVGAAMYAHEKLI
ncbi:MAG: polyphosphate--glucose phosphotransferase [Saprospiraceae bacterium]